MNLRFESGVVLYGSQTVVLLLLLCFRFESGVVLYGSQTRRKKQLPYQRFESGVVLYGSQTPVSLRNLGTCLRVV